MSEAESRLALDGAAEGMSQKEFSRRNFLKTAAWTGAALSAAGIGGASILARPAQAVHEGYEELGDVAILQFAYVLELLEGTFYARGVEVGITSGSALTQIAAIRDHEMAHADALAAALKEDGAEVPATPEFTYPAGVFSDYTAFLETAATFEPVGIGAYQGAAPALQNKEYLASAVSIHNAEGQHRVAINVLQGVVPSNDMQFGEALPLAEVQEAVAPFGVEG